MAGKNEHRGFIECIRGKNLLDRVMGNRSGMGVMVYALHGSLGYICFVHNPVIHF